MRILITGSAGFVGSHLVEHILINTDWEIVGLDSFRHKGDSMRLMASPRFGDARYKIYCHDLNAPISQRLISEIGYVDYVINLASESHVDRSISDPVPFVQNNVNLCLNALQYAREVQPRCFIQISTDEVYGAAMGKYRHKEWDTILPSNPYSASKACQEAIAISYWRTYGVPLVITNTMNMFGERQDREKFIPMCIKRLRDNDEVPIHGTQHKIGSRFYLHARNFADALLFILQNVTPHNYVMDSERASKPKRFNVVGEIELDNLEVLSLISKLMGKPGFLYKLIDFHSARPGHDPRYALNGELLAKQGWKQPMNFEASLRKTIEWTLAHPVWL